MTFPSRFLPIRIATVLLLSAGSARAHAQDELTSDPPPSGEPVATIEAPTRAEPAPEAMKACFSPREACKKQLLKFMKGATKSLDVAVYDFHEGDYAKTLRKLAKKVKLRVLADETEANRRGSVVNLLAGEGVDVRYGIQPGLFHDNFILRDATALETGSFNLTDNSAKANRENQLYVYDKAIVARYRAEFDGAWEQGVPLTALTNRARLQRVSHQVHRPARAVSSVTKPPPPHAAKPPPARPTAAPPAAPPPVAPKPIAPQPTQPTTTPAPEGASGGW